MKDFGKKGAAESIQDKKVNTKITPCAKKGCKGKLTENHGAFGLCGTKRLQPICRLQGHHHEELYRINLDYKFPMIQFAMTNPALASPVNEVLFRLDSPGNEVLFRLASPGIEAL